MLKSGTKGISLGLLDVLVGSGWVDEAWHPQKPEEKKLIKILVVTLPVVNSCICGYCSASTDIRP